MKQYHLENKITLTVRIRLFSSINNLTIIIKQKSEIKQIIMNEYWTFDVIRIDVNKI